MSKYITGQEILEHWDIKGFELFDHVRNGLKAYTKTGRIFECPPKYNLKTKLDNVNKGIASIEHPDFPNNLSSWDRERLTYFEIPGQVLKDLKKKQLEIKGKLKKIEMGNEDGNKCSWYYCALPELEEDAVQLIDRIINSYFLETDVLKKIGQVKKGKRELSVNIQQENKLRSIQIHKIECRKVAKQIWKKDPSITIEDMIHRDEINKVSSPKTYGRKTLRNWIKDLCPDRSPGRRPKKVKADI